MRIVFSWLPLYGSKAFPERSFFPPPGRTYRTTNNRPQFIDLGFNGEGYLIRYIIFTLPGHHCNNHELHISKKETRNSIIYTLQGLAGRKGIPISKMDASPNLNFIGGGSCRFNHKPIL
ncbi:hypothetical protein [Dinghuibacter silviterrae]|uniref:hypothetical protein n=1 Tax=Dinghuibacter silviterrae TaxID=1539049 RepID=UPI001062EE71|nr:hypothetical protein [Dinghuibacter silviterrae]